MGPGGIGPGSVGPGGIGPGEVGGFGPGGRHRSGGGSGAGAGGFPGGAGGGRGQGGEDSEHQRKYIQDSDEWFRPERDEDGGILRDPVTGMPVVPPVIGE